MISTLKPDEMALKSEEIISGLPNKADLEVFFIQKANYYEKIMNSLEQFYEKVWELIEKVWSENEKIRRKEVQRKKLEEKNID